MAQTKWSYALLAASALLYCGLPACSKPESPGTSAAQGGAFTEQAKEAIQEHARRPINKARLTQELGDPRTDAVDAAVKTAAGQ